MWAADAARHYPASGCPRAAPRGALRLVAITLGDLSLSNAGVLITVCRSKTDQEGAGRDVGIPRSRSKQNG